MKAMINIGSKQSKKNLAKIAVFVAKIFKAGRKNKRSKEEVIAALELATKAFASNFNTVSGCTLNAGKPAGIKWDRKK